MAGEHYQCLDVVRVAFGGAKHDCAILLEIWDRGALLQTSVPIPQGEAISFETIAGGVPAEVISCERDSYGYNVEVSIREAKWFPESYMPDTIILPDSAKSVNECKNFAHRAA